MSGEVAENGTGVPGNPAGLKGTGNMAPDSSSKATPSAFVNGVSSSDQDPGCSDNKTLHLVTPLLKSRKLSDKVGANVWLKLENVQNSGSFKIRGLGNFCKKAVQDGCQQLVSSSGGNAGLAAIYCAQELELPITVVVPEPTPGFIVDKMRSEGATVEVLGSAWDEANERAKELAARPGSVLVHPFDHPDIWRGHESLVYEVKDQLSGRVPDAVILSVGGGGLLCGVLQGLHSVGWSDIPVVAIETEGAASFNACVRAQQWVAIDKITSVAKCLGAKRVCESAYDWVSKHRIISLVVSDRDALAACVGVADDHRVLVAPACGAALSAVYGDLLQSLQKEGKLPQNMADVVVVVCGGSGVNLDSVMQWKKTLQDSQ